MWVRVNEGDAVDTIIVKIEIVSCDCILGNLAVWLDFRNDEVLKCGAECGRFFGV